MSNSWWQSLENVQGITPSSLIGRVSLRLALRVMPFWELLDLSGSMERQMRLSARLSRRSARSNSAALSFEAEHVKIHRLENGIEDFSLNIAQHIHHFHQSIFAIGSSILEILHPQPQVDSAQNFRDRRQEFIRSVA
jgi:hypothetical protein